MSLTDKFVLASFGFSFGFSLRKSVPEVSRQVLRENNANSRSGNFTKRLFPEALEKKINSLVGAARNFLYKNTLPSGVENLRLLKVVQRGKNVLFDLEQEMLKFRDNFEEVKIDLIRSYPDIVNAARDNLGDLFNPKDYPPVEKVASAFGMSFTIIPIDSSLDVFRQFETAAKEDCLGNIAESFDKLAKNLAEPDKIFKGTVVDTLQSFVNRFAEFIPARMLDRIEEFTASFDADSCREDSDVRKATSEKAGKIAVDISDIL